MIRDLRTSLANELNAKSAAVLTRNLWPVADQMLISATNFLTTILLARALSLAEFGAFTLMFSILLFANCVQTCLVTQPHNVLAAALPREQYVRYTTSTAFFQLAILVATIVVVWIAAAASALVAPQHTATILALSLAMAASQLQEFPRRVLYTEERFAAACITDAIACSGQVLCIVFLARDNLRVPEALVALGGGSLAGALFGFWRVRKSFGRSADSSVTAANWNYGKWLLGSELLGQWLATQLLVILAAATSGAGAAGILRAAHTLLGPSRVLSQVFCTTLPTKLTRVLATCGPAAMADYLRRVHFFAVPLLGLYCLTIAIAARPLLSLVFGDEFGEHHQVLVVYATAAFAGYLTMIASAALRARRRTRAIFVAELLSLPVLLVGPMLVPALGLRGIVLGWLAADLALLVLLWRAYSADDRLEHLISADPTRPGGPLRSLGLPTRESAPLGSTALESHATGVVTPSTATQNAPP